MAEEAYVNFRDTGTVKGKEVMRALPSGARTPLVSAVGMHTPITMAQAEVNAAQLAKAISGLTDVTSHSPVACAGLAVASTSTNPDALGDAAAWKDHTPDTTPPAVSSVVTSTTQTVTLPSQPHRLYPCASDGTVVHSVAPAAKLQSCKAAKQGESDDLSVLKDEVHNVEKGMRDAVNTYLANRRDPTEGTENIQVFKETMDNLCRSFSYFNEIIDILITKS